MTRRGQERTGSSRLLCPGSANMRSGSPTRGSGLNRCWVTFCTVCAAFLRSFTADHVSVFSRDGQPTVSGKVTGSGHTTDRIFCFSPESEAAFYQNAAALEDIGCSYEAGLGLFAVDVPPQAFSEYVALISVLSHRHGWKFDHGHRGIDPYAEDHHCMCCGIPLPPDQLDHDAAA